MRGSVVLVGIDRYPLGVAAATWRPPGEVGALARRLPPAFDRELVVTDPGVEVTGDDIRSAVTQAAMATRDLLWVHVAAQIRTTSGGSVEDVLIIGQDGRYLELSLMMKLLGLSRSAERLVTLDCDLAGGWVDRGVLAATVERTTPGRCSVISACRNHPGEGIPNLTAGLGRALGVVGGGIKVSTDPAAFVTALVDSLWADGPGASAIGGRPRSTVLRRRSSGTTERWIR